MCRGPAPRRFRTADNPALPAASRRAPPGGPVLLAVDQELVEGAGLWFAEGSLLRYGGDDHRTYRPHASQNARTEAIFG